MSRTKTRAVGRTMTPTRPRTKTAVGKTSEFRLVANKDEGGGGGDDADKAANKDDGGEDE